MFNISAARYGTIIYPRQDTIVGESFNNYGEYSEGETLLYKHLIKTNDTVLDIGAHIGSHTIVFSRLVGEQGVVIAFEPQRMLYYALCGNIAVNNLYNVICIQNALSSQEARINVPELNFKLKNDFGSLRLDQEYPSSTSNVSVRQITIDSLGKNPAFMKIDTPGMELSVLLGAIETIKKSNPIIYINNDQREKQIVIINLIKSLGYKVWMHSPLYFNQDNFMNNDKDVFNNQCSINMLCYHESKLLDINPQQFNCIECLEDGKIYLAAVPQQDKHKVINEYRENAINELVATAHAYAELDSNLTEAMRHLDIAISVNANNWELYNQAAPILTRFMKNKEALEYVEKALALSPSNYGVLRNKAIILANTGKYKEAIKINRNILKKYPTDVETHFNLSFDLLANGEFTEGFQEYEWRYKRNIPSLIDFVYSLPKIPFWNGEDISGKRILVINEQGIGDQIHFLRYLPKLQELGGHVVLTCQPCMHKVLQNLNVELFPHSVEARFPNDCDYMISIMSLPRFFGIIDKQNRYLHPVIEDKFSVSDKFNIGICWAGSEIHKNDFDRSCPLKYFKPLLNDDVQLYSLQKGNQRRYWPLGEVNLLEDAYDFDMEDITYQFQDVNDTANFIEKLDLVITVDTSIAHLAAAMGKKTFVLIGQLPCWRWPSEVQWYNSMKLFYSDGNWSKVMKEINLSL